MIKTTSIILPCYNVEKYLARSIQSVLDQTDQDFELLVIIDGSPDDSKKIADSFAQADSRIKVFEKENGGLSDARNYGLERATGEFVYFMDSDDWIEPNLLADNIKIMEEENLDLVIFGYIQDDENNDGAVIGSREVLPPNTIFIKKEKNMKIDSNLLGLLGYAWNKIYRRDFLVNNNLRFEKGTSLVEDMLFNADVYCQTDTLRTVDKAYYHYLNRPVSTLVKKYHSDSFDLILKRKNAIEKFLTVWHFSTDYINAVLAKTINTGIKYCIHNLFFVPNNLEMKEKEQELKKMLSHSDTQKLITVFKAKTLKDKIYKICVKRKILIGFRLLSKLK